MMMKEYNEIKKVIDQINGVIYIAGHENTDYDSICSSLALTRFLNLLGKEAYMLLEEKDFEKLTWFQNYDYIKTVIEIEHYTFIQMDSNRKSRLGVFEPYFDHADMTINIDHHENNKKEANYILSIGEISSTSEIVYNLIQLFEKKMDQKIAALLFAGIVSDTYCFLQRTTSNTFSVASALLEYGISNQEIIKAVYLDKTEEEIKILSNMLSSIQYDEFHYIIMDREHELYKNADYNIMFKKCISTVQNISSIKLLGLFLIDGNQILGEFRSNCEIDVDDLAIRLGGGGHKKASGFTTTKDLKSIIEVTKMYLKENQK